MDRPAAASVFAAEQPPRPAEPIAHPPTMVLRSEVRAFEYRTKARDASARARASVLERVRERHSLAASMWSQLADDEDRRTLVLRKRYVRA
jgi:hypothetical protein